MAPLTSQAYMPAGQREGAQVVIEIGIFPSRGVMAGGAVHAILSGMFISLLVAGVAIHRCAFELPVHMAGLTSNFRVLALQFECREIVIELCGGPAFCRMALAAIQPKAGFVRIIGMMTGIAILQCHREIPEAAGIDMALYAGNIHMLAC